jgi:hypothetical protein
MISRDGTTDVLPAERIGVDRLLKCLPIRTLRAVPMTSVAWRKPGGVNLEYSACFAVPGVDDVTLNHDQPLVASSAKRFRRNARVRSKEEFS